jgi:hypothetical protein
MTSDVGAHEPTPFLPVRTPEQIVQWLRSHYGSSLGYRSTCSAAVSRPAFIAASTVSTGSDGSLDIRPGDPLRCPAAQDTRRTSSDAPSDLSSELTTSTSER